MFKNYLTVALRNLRGNKAYALINISGLTMGMACSILILLYVRDEMSYDRFHQDSDRIYRVVQEQRFGGYVQQVAVVAAPIAPALVSDYPEVESSVRLRSRHEMLNGLLGLSVFSIEQRTKEIGVRKVLGATVTNVTTLLSKDFVKLVLLANVIAWPVAWVAMNRWLQNFAYRIEISWWIFALAGGLALLVALLTVGTQAIRAALANPVESLRYE